MNILAIIVLLLVVLLGFMGNYIYRNNLIGFGNTATNSQLLRSLDYDNIPVVGLPVENALSIAREYGIKLEIEEYEFSDDYALIRDKSGHTFIAKWLREQRIAV